MFPHEYSTTTQSDARRRDRAMREAYDRGDVASIPGRSPRRAWLVVLLVVLVAAAAYGVWWIATNDEFEIGSAVEAPVAALTAFLG